MKDLHIDNRPVDMAGFIANNGTLPGVCEFLQCDDSHVLYLWLTLMILTYTAIQKLGSLKEIIQKSWIKSDTEEIFNEQQIKIINVFAYSPRGV